MVYPSNYKPVLLAYFLYIIQFMKYFKLLCISIILFLLSLQTYGMRCNFSFDKEELTKLVNVMEHKGIPAAISKITDQYASYLPANVQTRHSLVQKYFGERVSSGLDMTLSPKDFIHELIIDASMQGLALSKGNNQDYLLVKFFETAVKNKTITNNNHESLKKIQQRLLLLEKDTSLSESQIVHETSALIGAHLPVGTNIRSTVVEVLFGEHVSRRTKMYGSNKTFAYELISNASKQGKIFDKDINGDFILLKLLDKNWVSSQSKTSLNVYNLTKKIEALEKEYTENGKDIIHSLGDLIHLHLPTSPNARAAAVYNLFGKEIAMDVPMSHSNTIFIFKLLSILGPKNLIFNKDKNHKYNLLKLTDKDWVSAQKMEPINTERAKTQLAKLEKGYNEKGVDVSSEVSAIIAPYIAEQTAHRLAAVTRVFGKDVTINVAFVELKSSFSTELVNYLHSQNKVFEKDVNGNYLLLEMLPE